MKIYIGLTAGTRQIFRSAETPTAEAKPEYSAYIGPFRTLRAARFCRNYPLSMCENVAAFEWAAKQEAKS